MSSASWNHEKSINRYMIFNFQINIIFFVFELHLNKKIIWILCYNDFLWLNIFFCEEWNRFFFNILDNIEYLKIF